MSEIRIQMERIEKDGKPIAPYRWRMTYEGKELGVWKDPECSAARELLARGYAKRDDVLATYRGSAPSMRGQVGWLADRRISEEDKAGLHWVKWRPETLGRIAKDSHDDSPLS